MKKDDILRLEIIDIGADGAGIGKADGMTFFVKDAIIGDVVEAKIMKLKKSYGYARLMKVLEPSSCRVALVCPVAKQCGGCQIQEMAYEEQLRFKENKVRNNLIRIGGFAKDSLPMEPIVGMEEPFYYRNKAQFPVGTDKEGHIIAGFYAARSHYIIHNRKCYLGAEINEEILNRVISYMEREQVTAYDEASGKGLVRHVLIRCGFTTGEIMVCLVVNGDRLPKSEALVKSLQEIPGMTSISLNVNRERTNVILGHEVKVLWGRGYIEDYIGDVKYQISPLSFFQVNPVQTKKLYGLALEYAQLTGKETVWDLYCGIGTISLFLAQKAKQVYGVEIVPAAIEDAKNNAKINHIGNAEFYVGKAEDILPKYYEDYAAEHGGERAYADVIVVDPPRKGCDAALLETMLNMRPERIVYVSCDSATLARDLRVLCDGGYELIKVRPVDQFPMTTHVETVVLLSKGEIDSKKVRVEFSLEDMNMSGFQEGATYGQIKDYVLETSGLKVSSLYISQIKRKHGLEVGKNYNLSKKENARVPNCPLEKEQAITEALKHFHMI
ncbi:MAG: 23S rRNA (uracil(1939)-C(5))-methyltransferase RlmD [Eubacteriales bacterium]|nr:23S rRNA (uracil(1939)-C(5))-methyltransferase RlmD [Eubacteriales bacterium]